MGNGERARVVIVGAGFGGLWALRTLERASVDVVLIDRNNYHTFLPLLYQVAAAEIGPEEIAYPIRNLLRRQRNAAFLMADVEGVDWEARLVKTHSSTILYDFLILAIGSTAHFFGVPGAAAHGFPIRTMKQAIVLRNHILHCFEKAVHEPGRNGQQQLLTFTIVGGGPTGVEFAGALAELIHGSLRKDYPTLDFDAARILLLEAADTLLPVLPAKLRAYAFQRLQHMGVDVRLGATVSEVTQEAAYLKDGTAISSATVVWTAGVQGEPRAAAWGLPAARNGQIRVLPTLQVPDHPEGYVIGDLAYAEEDGHPLPMIAPVAVQQGQAAAQNVLRQIAGEPPRPFRYRDQGTLVTIGRNAAAAHVFGRAFTGFSAWVLWLSVHLFKLIGFRNRLFVLINWAWDYFFYERTTRLILPMEDRVLCPSSEITVCPCPALPDNKEVKK